MVNITLSVPEELRKEMQMFPEMNWSVIARTAFKRRIEMLKKLREFVNDSEFTEEDAIRLGKEVNKAVSAKYKK